MLLPAFLFAVQLHVVLGISIKEIKDIIQESLGYDANKFELYSDNGTKYEEDVQIFASKDIYFMDLWTYDDKDIVTDPNAYSKACDDFVYNFNDEHTIWVDQPKDMSQDYALQFISAIVLKEGYDTLWEGNTVSVMKTGEKFEYVLDLHFDVNEETVEIIVRHNYVGWNEDGSVKLRTWNFLIGLAYDEIGGYNCVVYDQDQIKASFRIIAWSMVIMMLVVSCIFTVVNRIIDEYKDRIDEHDR